LIENHIDFDKVSQQYEAIIEEIGLCPISLTSTIDAME
jgi:hypothetical protein